MPSKIRELAFAGNGQIAISNWRISSFPTKFFLGRGLGPELLCAKADHDR